MNCNNNKALQLIESVKTARVTTTIKSGSNTDNKNSNNKISAIINTNDNKTILTNNKDISKPVNHSNNAPALLHSQQSQQSPHKQHLIPKLTSIPTSITNP